MISHPLNNPSDHTFYTYENLKLYSLAKGTERFCFLDPTDSHFIIKLSKQKRAKQTLREIKYFSFLKRHNIPFTHLAAIKQIIQNPEYIGFIQQRICNEDGSPSVSLKACLDNPFSDIKELLAELIRYMYRYNILPCDLQTDNILVQQNKNHKKLFLIDGLGCTDFINIAQYYPWLGRKKILRKFLYFLTTDAHLKSIFPDEKQTKCWLHQLVNDIK